MTTTPRESDADAYQRGRESGEVSARLGSHDQHFAAINGSIDRLGNEMHQLVVSLQRFTDAAAAREETALATARALAEADEERRRIADRKWSGFQKVFAIIATVAAMSGISSVLYTFLH